MKKSILLTLQLVLKDCGKLFSFIKPEPVLLWYGNNFKKYILDILMLHNYHKKQCCILNSLCMKAWMFHYKFWRGYPFIFSLMNMWSHLQIRLSIHEQDFTHFLTVWHSLPVWVVNIYFFLISSHVWFHSVFLHWAYTFVIQNEGVAGKKRDRNAHCEMSINSWMYLILSY